MFRRKTVIVVGAGASSEVGLPTGAELKADVANKLSFEFELDQWRQSRMIKGDPYIANFLNALRANSVVKSDPFKAAKKLSVILPQGLSIDTVLDNHSDDETMTVCGKCGIFSSIIQSERKSSLFHSTDTTASSFDFKRSEDSWFHFFFMLLTEGAHQTRVKDIFKNLTFIIFNYDRCIEYYLCEALLNYYRLDSIEVTNIVKELKIFHPYGTIGKLNWRDSGTELDVSFGSENYNLLTADKTIKTFSERVDGNSGLVGIQKEIQEAETLIFLGFAFHEQNMQLLSTVASTVRNIYGTALNVSNSDTTVIKETIKNTLNPIDSSVKINLGQSWKCSDIFKEFRLSLMR